MRTKVKTEPKINAAVDGALRTLASSIVSRVKMGQQLGLSYGGARDLYAICGYAKQITFAEYQGRYDRQDIASRIVNAYPDATWRTPPEVYETEGAEDTKWEQAWDKIDKSLRLYHYLGRADRLAGIGRYSVLFLGFDDGKSFDQPAKGAKGLMYVQVYNESNAAILEKDLDTKSPRYGFPTYYSLRQPDTDNASIGGTPAPVDAQRGIQGRMVRVHWSRCLHIADGCSDSDIYGTPRLQSVYNRLQDLELMAGGSAEMWWRSGFPGLQFTADADTELPDKEEMKTEIENYIHGLQRYLRLRGVKAEAIGTPGSLTAPTAYFDLEIGLISAATQIPKRILLGSERGELASDQDERAWHDRVDERRNNWAAPSVMQQLIRLLTDAGILPPLSEGVHATVQWAPIEEQSPKEKQEIAQLKTTTLGAYLSGGIDQIIPPKQFLMVVMGMTEEEADTMIEESIDYQDSPEKEALEGEPEPPPGSPPGTPPGSPPGAQPEDGQPPPPPAPGGRPKQLKASSGKAGKVKPLVRG